MEIHYIYIFFLFTFFVYQIERRRENLRPVQPKPPQGFKDYLMNRCSYVLAGNATSRLSPIMTPPAALNQVLKDLFTDQEKERYRLRLQVKPLSRSFFIIFRWDDVM